MAATPIDASRAADRGLRGPVRRGPPDRPLRTGPGGVGIAQKTGFGLVCPLAGIWPSLHLDTAITLPVRIELVAPGHVPARWEPRRTAHGSVLRRREPGQWYLLFQGIAAGNGYGDSIDASRAGRIT